MPQRQATAGAEPPLVFISYSHNDSKWKERLLSHLEMAEQSAQIAVWHDQQVGYGEKWETALNEALSRASVAVLLISPAYLASEWINEREVQRLLERQQQSGELRLFPILLEQCAWQQLPWLSSIQLFPPGAKPLASRSRNTQQKLLREAADAIVQLATGRHPIAPPTAPATPTPSATQPVSNPSAENITDFALSPEMQSILQRARVLATFRQPPELTTTCLLFALAESGRAKARSFRTMHFFWSQLESAGTDAYRKAFQLTFPAASYTSTNGTINFDVTLSEVPPLTPNVSGVLQKAAEIARQTRGPAAGSAEAAEIHARHLFAALLVYQPAEGNTSARECLATLLPDAAALRRSFLSFLRDAGLDDSLENWAAILSPETPDEIAEADPATSAVADVTEAEARAQVAGFLSDYWQGADLLGITPDVNAFAALLAAWSVEPPLSIGLFGEWGSGKSHFMRQLKARVELLSRRAYASQKPQNQLGYYKNIVQIEFNAWHYVEGNLWASLVEHIFTHLKLSEKEETSVTEQRRLELLKNMGVQQELQKKVTARQKQLAEAADKAQAEADKARNEYDKKLSELAQLRGELTKQLNLPVQFTEAQEEQLKELDIEGKALKTSEGLSKQYQELKSLWGLLRAQAAIFRKDEQRWRKVLWLLAVPFVATALLKLVYWLLARPQLSGAKSALSAALTFLLAAAVRAKPYWQKFKGVLELIKQKNRELDDERRKHLINLDNQVRALDQQRREAEREAETIGQQIQALQEQIDSTTTDRMLAEFIEARAAADDYRRHLGTLALIRRDFEQLSVFFSEQRAQQLKGQEGSTDQAINRVILYIDDLDRCPPRRVVEVLQAIHLLLAFPLFVVVVGVDARWVTRSLQETYEWLKPGADGLPVARKAEGVTPHDYLEKIFQIPFWLKPMGADACRDFLEGLTKDARADLGRKQPAVTDLTLSAAVPTQTNPPANAAQPAIPAPPDSQNSEPTTTAQPSHVPATTAPANDGAPPPQAAAPIAADADARATDGDAVQTSRAAVAHEAGVTAEVIDLHPQSLLISDVEVAYMKELAPLISRSPRAAKRFLNCYRLIKVGLRGPQLTAFLGERGEYKAVMLLLSIVTGAPTVALYVIEALEKLAESRSSDALHLFLQQLQQSDELKHQADWPRVKEFLESRTGDPAVTLASLIAIAPRVSRYAFRVGRVEVARPTPAPRQKLPASRSVKPK